MDRAQYIRAAMTFVEQEKMDKEIIGIIITDAIWSGRLDKNSDVDLHVILHPACDYRERGNTWIDGVEIEYFRNPPQQIRAYFREEKSRHSAHLIASGRVAYSCDPEVDNLIQEARVIMSDQRQKPQLFGIELGKYFVDDLYKDLEDAFVNEDWLGTELLRNKIIDVCIDYFFKIRQEFREKEKRVSLQLEDLDPEFHQLIMDAYGDGWKENSSMPRLRGYIDQVLGGPRTREWKLSSPLDL